MKEKISSPQAIYLYDEGLKKLDFTQQRLFIEKNFGRLKVHRVRLKQNLVQTKGLLFDLLATQKAFAQSGYAGIKDACQIILTERLFATLGQDNKAHIRSSVYSFPSVISVSGIVEGPAKPRQYYLYKQRYASLGAWDLEEAKIKKRFAGRFIDYADRRLNAVLKGYLAQAVFFYLTGEPFCKNKACRLYNAHWQEELIFAQIQSGGFCLRHQAWLKEFRRLRKN